MMETETENPIQAALMKLTEAKLKLEKAEFLRKLGDNLIGWRPVQISDDSKRKFFGDANYPNWADDIFKEAMRAGCEQRATQLERLAQEESASAADMLKPPGIPL